MADRPFVLTAEAQQRIRVPIRVRATHAEADILDLLDWCDDKAWAKRGPYAVSQEESGYFFVAGASEAADISLRTFPTVQVATALAAALNRQRALKEATNA